ncbi:MAG: amylo-alpha-1,6-glucosidase [Gaiellaceae bacterium]
MLEKPVQAGRLEGLAPDSEKLVRRALEVLRANWTGRSTVPSPSLYPHQWSWDSACIAIGYSRLDQGHAELELRSLFAGQWRNGLVPHIVFSERADYFPGPEFWQTERAANAPRAPRTSGIVQPPVHATAALEVYRGGDDRARAHDFLAQLYPKLDAWHGYLYRERDRNGNGLVEIWHPWESGMDNSPLWDAALARITLDEEDVPEYTRVDMTLTNPDERPTNSEYDRYAYLVKLYRDNDYEDAAIRDACPFVVYDVLFNSLLVEASRDLARIAEIVGEDPEPHLVRAAQTAAAIESELWSPEHAAYLNADLRGGDRSSVRVWTAFAPLYAGVPTELRAQELVQELRAFTVSVRPAGRAVTSVPPDDSAFEPSRYWRGPVWPMVNWVVHRGLRRYGYTTEAEELRTAMLELVGRAGFWEHYHPFSGDGQGGQQFAWTAGLVLDLLLALQGLSGANSATHDSPSGDVSPYAGDRKET